MGGGAGSRLYPLTKDRSKPAVPLGGKYRLVDIPISNCLNSGMKKIYVLTQFNSTSLHRHINASYQFDHFSKSFVEILAAQQTPEGSHWYQGTADAVRQNMRYFLEDPYEYYVILSGDQLYRMDYTELLTKHILTKADITIATIPVTREAATDFGIMDSDPDYRITRFVEKPKEDKVLDSLRIPPVLLKQLGQPADADLYQASMGIYVFNRKVLEECLDNDFVDFGKHIIPAAIQERRVTAHIFQGYWEDIGTIRAFYEANLKLTDLVPEYSFFETNTPVYTHRRYLPATKINGAMVRQAIISDGCIITDCSIERSVIGIRAIINSGSTVRASFIMGSDYYETTPPTGFPAVGIGKNCVIDRAIIDKNARIGDGCVITPEGKPDHMDGDNFFVRDGIIVIPKNGVIAAGRWI